MLTSRSPVRNLSSAVQRSAAAAAYPQLALAELSTTLEITSALSKSAPPCRRRPQLAPAGRFRLTPTSAVITRLSSQH